MIRGKSKMVSTETNNENKLEKKHIEYLITSCAIISTQCGKKELKVSELKCQPHYTTVFRQIKIQLESILTFYKNLDTICKNEYLLMTKNEMYQSFTEFSRFVHEEAARIGNTQAISRRKFFNYIVHFQFLALEIIAYFPTGAYNPKKVTITKLDPRNWWEKHFPNKIFVLRRDFMAKLRKDFSFNNEAEAKSFENCLDFTKTRYVTTFEFDMITRLYFPWKEFIIIWSIIYNHPGYLHFGTYGETKDILNQHLSKPGTYIFRASCKDLGFWTIGYVKEKTNDMGQVKVDKSSLIDALIQGREKKIYLYPNGELHDPDLSLYRTKHKEVFIDNDELALYDSVSHYKECKICRENEKDIMFESCGHMICEVCFKKLGLLARKTCPYCNQLIKSHSKIVHQKRNEEKEDIYFDASGKKESDDVAGGESTSKIADKKPGNQEAQKKAPELPRRPQMLNSAVGQLINFNQPKVNQDVQNDGGLNASSIQNQSDEEDEEMYASMTLNDSEITESNDNKAQPKSSSPSIINVPTVSVTTSRSAQGFNPVSGPPVPPIPGPYPSVEARSSGNVSNIVSDFNDTDEDHKPDSDDGMYATFEEEITEEQHSPIVSDRRSFTKPLNNSHNPFISNRNSSKPQIPTESKSASQSVVSPPVVPPFPTSMKYEEDVSEMYADLDDDTDTFSELKTDSQKPESNFNGVSDPFSKWSKPEVDKAMRIARFNKEIALDILKEYV